MIIRSQGSRRWCVVAAHYPDETTSNTAWERMERQMLPGPDTGLGISRMKPHPQQGVLKSAGAPEGRWVVTAITFSPVTATAAELLLLRSGGTLFDVDPEFADALVKRGRRQRTTNTTGQRSIIRRGVDGGGVLSPDGSVREVSDG